MSLKVGGGWNSCKKKTMMTQSNGDTFTIFHSLSTSFLIIFIQIDELLYLPKSVTTDLRAEAARFWSYERL